MANLGPSEIILIAVLLLILFGAKKLPEIGKALGKGLREFKSATKEITNPITSEEPKESLDSDSNKNSKEN